MTLALEVARLAREAADLVPSSSEREWRDEVAEAVVSKLLPYVTMLSGQVEAATTQGQGHALRAERLQRDGEEKERYYLNQLDHHASMVETAQRRAWESRQRMETAERKAARAEQDAAAQQQLKWDAIRERDNLRAVIKDAALDHNPDRPKRCNCGREQPCRLGAVLWAALKSPCESVGNAR